MTDDNKAHAAEEDRRVCYTRYTVWLH